MTTCSETSFGAQHAWWYEGIPLKTIVNDTAVTETILWSPTISRFVDADRHCSHSFCQRYCYFIKRGEYVCLKNVNDRQFYYVSIKWLPKLMTLTPRKGFQLLPIILPCFSCFLLQKGLVLLGASWGVLLQWTFLCYFKPDECWFVGRLVIAKAYVGKSVQHERNVW